MSADARLRGGATRCPRQLDSATASRQAVNVPQPNRKSGLRLQFPISIVAPVLGCNVQKRAGERPPAPFPFSVLTLNFLLPLHLPLIRDHLSGDDVRIDRHRLIAARADLDVVAPRRQTEQLGGRTEVRDLARELAVD